MTCRRSIKRSQKEITVLSKRFVDLWKNDNDFRYKCSIGRTGRLNPAAKTVFQYDKNMILIGEYHSTTEAELVTNVKVKAIRTCCSRQLKFAGGFIWRYKNDIYANTLPWYKRKV